MFPRVVTKSFLDRNIFHRNKLSDNIFLLQRLSFVEIFQDIAVQMLKEPIQDTFEIEPHIGPNAFAISSITDKLPPVTKA